MTTETMPAILDPGTRDVTEVRAPPMLSVRPTNLTEAMEFARLIAASNFVPTAFRGKHGDVLVVMLQAAELGVGIFTALQNTCVINGRPTIYGDLVIALLLRSGRLEYKLEHWDEESQTATVRMKRVGMPERVQTFSMADAKRANLTRNDTYTKYPQRMCMWRALTWAARAEFADVLAGITIAEEAIDFPPAMNIAPISQPRATATLVDEFLAPPTPAKGAKPASAPPPSREPGEMEVVKIAEAKKEKEGKTGKNSWTRYGIKLADGRDICTFSATHFEIAHTAMTAGTAVYITLKPGDPRPTIATIDPVLEYPHDEPPEGGA